MFKDKKSIFGGFIETHVKQPKNKKFINALLSGWSFERNYDYSNLGKIWVLWHPTVKVVVIAKSLQMITCQVMLPDTNCWIIISIVYASNDYDTRKGLWEELRSMASNQSIAVKPRIVMEDFNQVLNPAEHSSPSSLNVNGRIREFRKCLLDAELTDFLYRGTLSHGGIRIKQYLLLRNWIECWLMKIGVSIILPLLHVLGSQISLIMHFVA